MTATFELPGLRKEDVEIQVHNNRLTVSGESSTSEELDSEGYAVRERRYGRFSRTLPLPTGTKVRNCRVILLFISYSYILNQPEEVQARMDNGVLAVKFPKSKPETEAKRITVS